MPERLEEFRRYLYANCESLVNYNHTRIAGERVSTTHVESTVNQLVNWRMCKKQQMRWSAAGAQLLLHVRTADLNGRLGHYVGRAAANAPPQSRSPLDRPQVFAGLTYLGDAHALGPGRDQRNLVAGLDFPVLQHAEIEAGSSVLDDQCGHFRPSRRMPSR
jgi:hypothetical protein